MDTGTWIFTIAMIVIALYLWSKKRRGTQTRIDERGTPQMRIDEARRAAKVREQNEKDSA